MKPLLIISVIVALLLSLFVIFRQPFFSDQTTPPLVPVPTGSPEPTAPPPVTYKDLIYVTYPQPDATVSSPLTITGAARGNWYFEGSFPVILTNWDGLIIAETFAQAQGEWMVADYVPFTATLEFDLPQLYPLGSLILQKDNPSDDHRLDDAYEFSIYFDQPN